LYGTEIVLLFGRGNNSHTYSPGAFATQGAWRWLENAEIGNNPPIEAARQLEAFVISGCAQRVRQPKGGLARAEQQNTRSYCRTTILHGLRTILKTKGVLYDKIQMNYTHYEDKIVEALNVALDGWPLCSRVCNPGSLSCYEANTLKDALASGACKWVTLTLEEVAARKVDNWHRVANGEQVYGPPRKQRARNVSSQGVGDDEEAMDEDIA